MIQLVAANDLALANGVKMIVYARSGIGKTMLSATVPNPIVLSAEKGLLSLAKANIERVWGVNTPGIAYDIPVIEINDVNDLKEAFAWLQTPEGQHFNPILDSATEIAEQVLFNAKKLAKDPRQAYGTLIEQMTDTIKQFRDLPNRHVVLLCKEDKVKDEVAGTTLAGPSMPGAKMGPAAPYLTDEVFYLGVGSNPDKTTYRYLRTQPDFTHNAKDRSGALAEIEFPHLGNIIDKILAGSQPATN